MCHLYRTKKPYIVNGERVTLEEYKKTKYEDLRIRVPIGKKYIASAIVLFPVACLEYNKTKNDE